jgi:proline dehydrogenase
MVDFNNTEIAFKDKSAAEIRRAYWLFSIVGNPILVKIGAAILRLAMSMRLPVRWVLKPTVFKHFCGGENIAGCDPIINRLKQSGIDTILDFSAEGRATEADFTVTHEQILLTIEKATTNDAVPYAVFKPTGLVRVDLLEKLQSGRTLSGVESVELNRFYSRIGSICNRSWETGIPVMIDAEESWIQDIADGLVEDFMIRYNTEKPLIFNTLQMYRHDRINYLHQFVKKAREKGVYSAFKLVRGAYLEKERERAAQKGCLSPVYPDKQSTDDAFDVAVRFCLEQHEDVAVCIGTHNELSCSKAVAIMKELGMANDHPHVSFAQLLGMSDHISYKLAAEGYNVCKYVPYGPVNTVVPYLIRRAEENTSVAGQTGRELGLIRAEIKRRSLV